MWGWGGVWVCGRVWASVVGCVCVCVGVCVCVCACFELRSLLIEWRTLSVSLKRKCVSDFCIIWLHRGTPLVQKCVNDVLTIAAHGDEVIGKLRVLQLWRPAEPSAKANSLMPTHTHCKHSSHTALFLKHTFTFITQHLSPISAVKQLNSTPTLFNSHKHAFSSQK